MGGSYLYGVFSGKIARLRGGLTGLTFIRDCWFSLCRPMREKQLNDLLAAVVAIVAGCINSRQPSETVKTWLDLPPTTSPTNQPFRPDPAPSPVPQGETQDAFDNHLSLLYKLLVKGTMLLGMRVRIATLQLDKIY